MASNNDNPSVKMPPLENWAAQTFAYGFLLDRSALLDYSGNAAPNQSGRSGFDSPQPDDLHLLNLNPQSLQMSEPIATSVVPSQGGGKFVESRGGVMKSLSIRGTTGFMPPIAPYAQHMKTPDQVLAEVGSSNLSEFELAQVYQRQTNQTGFFEFYRLRKLFRQFMLERRQGKAVQMHWLDFKGDEFWMCEPMRFDLERTRFSYTYDIQLNLLEPSQLRLRASDQGFDTKDLRGIVNRDFGKEMLKNPLLTVLDSQQNNLLSRLSQMASAAKQFIQNFALGVVTLKFQSVLKNIGAIQSFFSDISAIRRATLDTVLNLYKQLNSSMQGLSDALEDFTLTAFRRDVNEWVIEARGISEALMANHVVKFAGIGRTFSEENSKYTQPRAIEGTKNAFLTETVNANAVTSKGGGLALIGNVEKMVSTSALRGEDVLTGETIFDVAQRLLGDAQRFVDLVIVNRLKPPFIVASTAAKSPGTIAWGEKILVPATDEADSLSVATPVQPAVPSFADVVTSGTPVSFTQFLIATPQIPYRDSMWQGFTLTWTSGSNANETRVITENVDQLDGTTLFTLNRALPNNPVAGDAFAVSLQLFSSRLPVTPETAAFGKDIMGVFTKFNGVNTDGTVDIMLSPRKDLATVQGQENLEQAITLALQTPRGSNKSNPLYGTSSVIGRPMEPNILALNVFYVRQSLLQDPRISSVEKPKVEYTDGALFFTVYVRPVRVQRTLFLRIPL